MRFKGSLKWIPFEEGGRRRAPTGPVYYCTTDLSPSHCFSIAVNTNIEHSRLCFLVKDSQLSDFKFEVGQELKLMEGNRAVGVFTIGEIE